MSNSRDALLRRVTPGRGLTIHHLPVGLRHTINRLAAEGRIDWAISMFGRDVRVQLRRRIKRAPSWRT